MININIPTDDTRTLIRVYLEILNIINPNPNNKLTDGEIKLLTEFLLLPEKFSYQRFSRYAKPVVVKNLKEYWGWDLSPINLNSKIYGLLDKEFIWRDEDGVLYIKDYLLKSVKLLESNKITIEFNASKAN